MSLNAVKILKISITKSSKKEILEEIEKYLDSTGKKPLKIVTPNPEQLVLARKNPGFAELLNQADISLPDGIGIAVFLGIMRIPGVEFMEDLVAIAQKRRVPIGLIGGRGKMAVSTFECLRNKYRGLTGWATAEISPAAAAIRIRKTGAKMIFVALGAPKQELYISKLSSRLRSIHYDPPTVLMAVGGSFDMIAGKLPRAPKIMRMMGLEWLWRLVLEPRRFRRQLALIEFVWLVLVDTLRRSLFR